MKTVTKTLALILLLGAGLSHAQEKAAEPLEPPAPSSEAQQEQTKPAKGEQEAEDGGEESPFEYRASEQISEDLSVSFPVDI